MMDITGNKYNMLTAKRFVYKRQSTNGSWKYYWLFECDCGNTKIAEKNAVKNGMTKSCGCQYRKKSRQLGLRNKKFKEINQSEFSKFYKEHNLKETADNFCISVACVRYLAKKFNIIKIKNKSIENKRLYRIYHGILDRCLNPNCVAYKYYGGRGISICKEWLENYSLFEKWAYQKGFKESLTIDRINVNGNYYPENCRWVDMKTQANNRTNSRFLTFNNITHTVSEWANILNIKYHFLYDNCVRKKQNLEKLINFWEMER